MRYLYDDGIGFVELHDFSRANIDNKSRINAITKVASICVGKDEATKPEKLFKRLSKESSMLPSSSYEFCPILLNMKQIEHIINSVDSINFTYVAHIAKYGELINNGEYLLTNLRALIYDVGLDNALNGYYSEPDEIQLIKDNFFVFKIKIPIFVARQLMRHRVSYQELSRRIVSGSKLSFEFYEPDESMEEMNDRLVLEYNRLIKQGMKPERARAVLPQSLYTTIWSAWNKSQLDNFFKLRIDKHAQQEIRVLAENMRELVKW